MYFVPIFAMNKKIFLTLSLLFIFFSCESFADSCPLDAPEQSPSFSRERAMYEPKIPDVLTNLKKSVLTVKREASFDESASSCFGDTLRCERNVYALRKTAAQKTESRPLRVGVVFSGGPAPGGHAVVSGLVDALKEVHPESQCMGFLNGFKGVLRNDARLLSQKETSKARHTGGFDLLGSGRDKIESDQSLETVLQVAKENRLDGLVVIGGDDSNTNALVIADYFQKKGCSCAVVGVPKTIDGDLQSDELPLSFGFDTATKTYSEMIGNVARDVRSTKKQYCFIKLMGRNASHVTLECAMKTHPNLVFISEEVCRQQKTLKAVVGEICSLIEERLEKGKMHGVILIPEGLIESLSDVSTLLQELNTLLAASQTSQPAQACGTESNEWFVNLVQDLSEESRRCFMALPRSLQVQLLSERDPHGNISVTKIETEKVLAHLVEDELINRSKQDGKERPFAYQTFFFGYEGRCQYPTNFDLEYALSLGRLAACAVDLHLNGYLVTIDQLQKPVSSWEPCFVPLLSMVSLEMRKGYLKPVIRKALVDLEGELFHELQHVRSSWRLNDDYQQPGPIQYWNEKLQEKPLMLR